MGKLTYGNTGLSYQCDKVEVKVEGAPKCPKCQQRVYFNEERKGGGKTWHIRCFTCSNCKKTLDSTNYNQHGEEELLCTGCYRKMCGPRLYGFVSGVTAPSTVELLSNRDAPANQSDDAESCSVAEAASYSSTVQDKNPSNCPRCGKRVYFAEEVKVVRRKWHRQCFKCQSCNKTLETGRFNEHNEDLFCQPCYGKLFGPRGYGYAGGNGSLLSYDPPSSGIKHSNNIFPVNGASNLEMSPPHLRNQMSEVLTLTDPLKVQVTEKTEPIKGIHEWTESFYVGASTTSGT